MRHENALQCTQIWQNNFPQQYNRCSEIHQTLNRLSAQRLSWIAASFHGNRVTPEKFLPGSESLE